MIKIRRKLVNNKVCSRLCTNNCQKCIVVTQCPCSPSSVNWYQLASGLGVRYCEH